MSNAKPEGNRWWTEKLDLRLLNVLAAKQKNLYSDAFRRKVWEDIVKEAFPTYTTNQCRLRLYRLQVAYNDYEEDRSKPLRYRLTPKVIAKMKQMWPYGTRLLLEKNSDPDGRRLWNDESDEILLDELIRLNATTKFHIKQSTFDKVAESLYGFTGNQCRNRWQALRKMLKDQPEKEWPASLHAKLLAMDDARKEILNGLHEKKQQPQKVNPRIWNLETEMLMLNGLSVLHTDTKGSIKPSVWDKISKDVMPSSQIFTPEKCRNRFSKLRSGYLERISGSETPKLPMEHEVFEKLCEMYGRTYQPKKKTAICRCCGQIPRNLIDLQKDNTMSEWFLAFTGISVKQMVRPYTQICQLCFDKLGQAKKFHEQCWVGAKLFEEELENKPVIPEPEQSVVKIDSDDNEMAQKPKEPKQKRSKGDVCCTQCGEMMPKANLRSHMRAHNPKRVPRPRTQDDLTCRFCQKTFQSWGRLERHVDYHIDGTIYECTECPKKFNCRGDFNKHVRLHKGKLPGHLCTICGKVYEQQVGLKYHMNTHIGLKPYKCTYCPKRFARIHGMNHHVRSRHENVSHECSYCGQKYLLPGKLKMHTVLKHQGAFLRCNHCDLESKVLKSFLFHLKDVHNTGFDQSVHVILGNGEKLIRRRKLVDSLIQTEKIGEGDGEETNSDWHIIEYDENVESDVVVNFNEEIAVVEEEVDGVVECEVDDFSMEDSD